VRLLAILLAFSLTAVAQRHSVPDVDAEKPEGKVLLQVMQTDDAAKKTALLEQFVEQFPKSDATPWALEQLLAASVKSGPPDKILAAGEKLLAADPDETEAALQCLKAAEAKHDLELIKKYSALSSTLAKKMMAVPEPKDAEELDTWKQEIAYAKQVDAYGEYALYRVFAESRDPKVTIEFADLLPQRYPNGQYSGKLDDAVFLAYRQTNQNDKALALAEKVLATTQTNEDMMLVVADNYLQNKKEPEKVHAYCAKLVEIMTAKPKPEGVADDAWSARKNTVIGLAHYMNGKLYFNENQFPETDRELRAAIPFVENNPASKGEVLFLLGFANYKMKKPQEAANFYRSCAAVKSDYQAKAAKNLQVIKQETPTIK
jgi:tetratricopeptide (TPR) repeat protein